MATKAAAASAPAGGGAGGGDLERKRKDADDLLRDLGLPQSSKDKTGHFLLWNTSQMIFSAINMIKLVIN